MQGDNDPVDVVEIGSKSCQMGGVYRVKPLGESAALGASDPVFKPLPVPYINSLYVSVPCHTPGWVSTGPVKGVAVLPSCIRCLSGLRRAKLMDLSCTDALH